MNAKDANRCATMEHHWRLARKDPEYRWRARQIEKEIQNWVARYSGAGLRTEVIRIPVVVHVIYNTANQNIPKKHIDSQINVLNDDFRRLNLDAGNTPLVFRGVAADARIEFALAVRDPHCNPTDGITRTKTNVRGWNEADNGMKAKATGGHGPWDVNKYLNIWVVNYLDENTLGYGTRPPEPPEVQGVVCDYRAFGTIGGNFKENAELGRTATHEIGHWLDLIHIWGHGEGCADSDNVDDTPNQQFATSFSRCPNFPKVSCRNGPNGGMFMNYMDASGDECKNMFTAGQVARMYATLHVARAGILDSQGLVPPIGPVQDLWIKDAYDDIGTEPDQSTQPMYLSDDIWVRRTNDGWLHQDHENPEYRPSASNYIYVRVRNRGCPDNVSGDNKGSGTLNLYWAKASTGLSWPLPWDGSVTVPALMGGPIGSKIVTVKSGESEIFEFPWSPPNPADYAAVDADRVHFSLLARIVTPGKPSYGMTFPETSDLYANVKNNNKIAWKNITIATDEPRGAGRFASVIVGNFTSEAELTSLSFPGPQGAKYSIFDWGRVYMEGPPSLIERLTAPGNDTPGIRRLDDKTLEILTPEAKLRTFELAPKEMHVLHIQFVPMRRYSLGVHVLTWDLVQETKERVVGGQRFVVKTPPDRRHIAIDDATNVFDGVSWVPTGDAGRNRFTCPEA